MDKKEAQSQIAKVLEEFEKSNEVVVVRLDINDYTIETFGDYVSGSRIREIEISYTAKPGEGWR